MVLALKAKRVCLLTDSYLVKGQTGGEYQIHEASLTEYNKILKQLMEKFDECVVDHITRSNNTRADALSKFAIQTPMTMGETRTVTLSTMSEPSIQAELLKKFSVMAIAEGEP